MPSPALTDSAIQDQLISVPDWEFKNGILSRTFAFPDFVAAMQFVNRVADAAEASQHHPDIDIRYSKVTLGLITHDSGGITAKDFDMARAIDVL